jgi:hypothetical protein
MHVARRPITRLLGATLFAAMVTGMALPGAHASSARHSANVPCAAVGSYAIGHPAPPAPIAKPNQSESGEKAITGTVTMTGTITIATYTSCGSATTGTFSVTSTHAQGLVHLFGHPGKSADAKVASSKIVIASQGKGKGDSKGKGQGGAPTAPTITSTSVQTGTTTISSTAVLSATGTFAQDPAHPKNPSYVVVTGTVTLSVSASACKPGCVTPLGATQAANTVVTKTITFSGVHGKLKVHQDGSNELLHPLPAPHDEPAD